MGKKSGWTIDTLKEHLEAVLREKDKAIINALASAKEAASKTEQAQRDYNVTHNDLLRKMDQQYSNMVPRQEFMAYKESAEQAIKVEKSRGDRGEGKQLGMNAVVALLVAAAAIGAFVVALWKH